MSYNKNTSGTEFYVGGSKVTIGKFTYKYEHLDIKQWGEESSLTVGKFCSLGEHMTIFLGGNHRSDWITTFPFGHIFKVELGGTDIVGHPISNGDVIIGNDVWIGSNVTIMSGATISDGSVIAANSTVIKDTLPYEIIGGNPASHIKYRFDQEIINLLLKLKWWDLELNDIKKITKQLCSIPTIDLLEKLCIEFRISNSFSR